MKYDHKWARVCVQDDWMGPVPRFSDKSFKRTFRITRSMVKTLVTHLTKRHSFWRQTVCRAGKPTICPYVKFLMGMKMLCYGVSGNAFVDYFQMGETTTRKCICSLQKGLCVAVHWQINTSEGQRNQMQETLLRCMKESTRLQG